MKTKFILHGGYAGRVNFENDKFFREILKDASQSAKILLVYFAKEKDEYERMQKEDISQFEKNGGERDLFFEVASSETFRQQIQRADVVYFHGGSTTLKLLKALKKFPNLKDLLNGKIIAGESAGANVFGKFFYSPIADKVDKGLDFLPLKIIPHYSEIYKGKIDGFGEGLESLLLPEYQYKVFEIIL